jgi:hypothetical protein
MNLRVIPRMNLRMILRMILRIKILSYHSAQRYAIRQTLWAALNVLKNEDPEIRWEISEVKDWAGIERYTPVLSAPSIVINEKLVSVGRFPSKQELLGWLRAAMEE